MSSTLPPPLLARIPMILGLALLPACAWGSGLSEEEAEREARVTAGFQAAEAFWDDLSHARVDALAGRYAPEVKVLAGSEVLKPEWGLVKERGRDAVVGREALVAAYGRMIDKIGAGRWTQAFASLPAEGQGLDLEDRGGNLVVCVLIKTGKGDDRFLFWLRETDEGWRVFEEEADY